MALLVVLLTVLNSSCLADDDGIRLTSGATLSGRVTVLSDGQISVGIKSGNRILTRTYPRDRVETYTIADVTYDGRTSRIVQRIAKLDETTVEELNRLIDAGSSAPEWLADLKTDFPANLDYAWPQPPQGGWDSSRNIGQYVWDRVNPNPSRWREGVALMHHVMQVNKEPEIQQRAMRTLGGMYHSLHQDYARAAWWYLKSGLDPKSRAHPQAVIRLADCYLQLNARSSALQIVRDMPARPYAAIKLLGDAGETDEAVALGEQFSRTGEASIALLYAGDACRVAGRLQQAADFYRRARQAAIESPQADKPHRKRDRARAEASLAVINTLQLKPADVKDGTYRASSPGYEADVEVETIVADGRIQSVRVTRHREKQFYSSIEETPVRILKAQSVNGVDATTGATITSEAIINATAKGMSQGRR